MPEPNEQPQFTPEQQLQLEQAKAARIAAETQLLEKQAELESVKRQERLQQENRVIREALDNGPRFHLNHEQVTKLLRDEEYALQFDESGATAVLDGKRMALHEFLEQYALGNEHLVDGRSLRSLKDAQERKDAESEVLCKSEMDLPTKVKYVEEHGLAAFEALPLRRPRITTVKTFEDYLELPLKQRMAYVERHGIDAAVKLPRRPRN